MTVDNPECKRSLALLFFFLGGGGYDCLMVDQMRPLLIEMYELRTLEIMCKTSFH